MKLGDFLYGVKAKARSIRPPEPKIQEVRCWNCQRFYSDNIDQCPYCEEGYKNESQSY